MVAQAHPSIVQALQHPAAHFQLLHSMLAAGAQGAARSAWVEINRPLTALALNADITDQLAAPTASGAALQLPTVSLPIGMDIKSITCTAADVDLGWQAVNFTLGTLNLVNPQGSLYGVNLSMFDPRLQHVDRLAPWILSKTKVDVQVTANLINGAFYANYPAAPAGQLAVFHGFSLNAFQEEQVCAIQTRIEQTDRNVGNTEIMGLLRSTLGAGLGFHMPAYVQPSSQAGRAPLAGGHAIPQLAPQIHVGAVPIQPMMPVLR
jgi:hypothetical protein